MGKEWDGFGDNEKFQIFNKKWATEALRVLKPGGFMFAMGGTRTHHRLTCGIEDAGFMIRDELCWVYMQGFPKAQDLGMLIEKKLGGQGEVVGIKEGMGKQNPEWNGTAQGRSENSFKPQYEDKQPTNPLAKEWQGWKTPALKPAFEPIVVAQKPVEGSITENVMKNGVGGYNIDDCRIPYENADDASIVDFNRRGTAERSTKNEGDSLNCIEGGWKAQKEVCDLPSGRYPSNLLMQEECFGRLSKYFLIPKASKSEKEENLDCVDEIEIKAQFGLKPDLSGNSHNTTGQKAIIRSNSHPTVKPIALMQHLIKLTTKSGYTVLDPFLGSGTTVVAALNLNRNVIGIEISEEYMKIAKARISEEAKQTRLF